MLKQILRFGVLSGFCLIVTTEVRAADQAKIKEAVAKAIYFLKSNYNFGGAAPRAASPGGNPNASKATNDWAASLAGIALLEAGVDVDDSAIQEIAQLVRGASIDQMRTYILSLEIIFLDKLGDEADTLLIQSMAARLILGQTSGGGWTYECPGIDSTEKERLRTKSNARIMKGSNTPPQIGLDVHHRPKVDSVVQEMLKTGAHLDPSAAGSINGQRGDDNSNTQFAIIALWSARRHGMPVDESLKRVEKRFRDSQVNGGWPYMMIRNQAQQTTPSMTCAGLLGLAVSSGMKSERVMKARGSFQADSGAKAEPRKDSPSTNPSPLNDPAVQAGLKFLTDALQASRAGNRNGQSAPPIPGGAGLAGELRANLYFLWSLERVCLVFGLKKLGPFDWYEWGVDWLLPNQNEKGSWNSAYGEVPDTAFALMFLVHANIVRDLTGVLKGTSPPDANSGKSKEGSSDSASDSGESALAQAILKAKPAKQSALIREYAEKHGSEYSLALAEAIPKLSDATQEAARSALAARMSRLKPSVVREWLQYDNAEIRRAAAIGTSIHAEPKSFIPDLIKALDDADELVWRGAGLALRTISKKDFGPRKGDSDEERQKARADWEAWWKTQQ